MLDQIDCPFCGRQQKDAHDEITNEKFPCRVHDLPCEFCDSEYVVEVSANGTCRIAERRNLL